VASSAHNNTVVTKKKELDDMKNNFEKEMLLIKNDMLQ
jgi:hypothetical protein